MEFAQKRIAHHFHLAQTHTIGIYALRLQLDRHFPAIILLQLFNNSIQETARGEHLRFRRIDIAMIAIAGC